MTVDEVLANPAAAVELPEGAVPTHVLVILEYLEPGSDDVPGVARIVVGVDDALPLHLFLGMLHYAELVQLDEQTVDD